MTGLRRVTVPIEGRAYDVVVGHGAVSELASLLPVTSKRVAVVTQEGVPATIETSLPHEVFRIGQGEQHKTLATVGELCRGFARMGLTRNDVVVGVGGGMVTDVAGFAAATYHRGVPVVHVATTLLGMVDAAVGGKTGVNLPEGKNLIGAFWQPSGVICDLDALATLPDREARCGYGEMAKYHFLTGDDLLAMDLTDRVARCVEIKADVVASDEREGGRHAILNYGHTLAHTLEIATEHRLAHGEAVAVGLIFAAHLAQVLGRIDIARVDQHFQVVGVEYGLDTDVPAGVEADRLVDLMRHDKKALDGLTFVLDGANGVEVVPGVDAAPVLAALTAHGAVTGGATGPELRSERLLLRRWTEPDRPAFHALNSDPQVMATIGPVMSRAESDTFMNRIEHRFDELGFGLWCIDLGGEAIGFTGLAVPWFRDGVEIGWRIRSGLWGRGYAPEAARACLTHGFTTLGFDEVISFTAATNAKSQRVMQKLGMRRDHDADFDHPSVPAGDPLRPHVLYRIARAEWQASEAAGRRG